MLKINLIVISTCGPTRYFYCLVSINETCATTTEEHEDNEARK